MLSLLFRSVIAITLGTLFLIALVIGLAIDVVEQKSAESRRIQTHLPGNRGFFPRS